MIMPVKSLTTLAEHGPHGQRVRVIVERGLVRVKYSENGARRFRSWTDSPSNRKTAKAWARAFSETRDTRSFAVPALAASLTTSGLWDAFTLAEFPHLREKTAKNYSLYWRKWQAFVGEATPIDTVTREAVDRYAAELLKVHVASEVRRHIKLVTHVYSWAVERDLSMAVKVASYRVKLSRDAAKSEPTTEFRSADSEKLLAYFDPAIQPANASRKWRVYVIQMILSLLGARINAVLHLRRDDINLSGRDGVSMPTITWRAEWDKVGKERTQPIPQRVVDALKLAAEWRERDGYTGEWIFYSAHEASAGPYTYAAYNWQLHQAEVATGVPHVARRGAHGFRRGIVGDIVDLTGDVQKAMEWVGDSDLKMARLYVKGRTDRMESVAALLDARTTSTPTAPETPQSPTTTDEEADQGRLNPSWPT